jgi:hypothetical protein
VNFVQYRHTLFGLAMIHALSGGASSPDQSTVTLRDIFTDITHYIQHTLTTINTTRRSQKASVERDQEGQAESNDQERRSKRSPKTTPSPGKRSQKGRAPSSPISSMPIQGDIDSETSLIHQTPCIYLPSNTLISYLYYPVCYRCSPPPAPERPYVFPTLSNAILLEWFNPPFDGVPPCQYKIYMKNTSRHYQHWAEISNPGNGNITRTTHLVRNLPIGIACRFKIRCFNHGGWSQESIESVSVVPGQHQTQPAVSQDPSWSRVRQGGILAILDHMSIVQHHRDELLTGLRMLHGIGCLHRGYKNISFTLSITQRCLDMMTLFKQDVEVISMLFQVLRWCLSGKYEHKVCSLLNATSAFQETIRYELDTHRHDAGMIKSIQGLKGVLGNTIPSISSFKYKLLFPEHDQKGDGGSDSGSEEEEEKVEGKKEEVVDIISTLT